MAATNRSLKLAGKKFGRLTVRFRVGISASSHSVWLCKCDCGATHLVEGRHLVSEVGPTRSCGCITKDRNRKKLFKHGYSIPRTSPDPLYSRWCMLRYKEGDAVCAEWKNFLIFLRDVLALEPAWQKGFWLMRKDQAKPWNKENCIWANAKRRRALRQGYRDARGGNWRRNSA